VADSAQNSGCLGANRFKSFSTQLFRHRYIPARMHPVGCKEKRRPAAPWSSNQVWYKQTKGCYPEPGDLDPARASTMNSADGYGDSRCSTYMAYDVASHQASRCTQTNIRPRLSMPTHTCAVTFAHSLTHSITTCQTSA
jgi:hypothetical protein